MNCKVINDNFWSIISNIQNEMVGVDITDIPIGPSLIEDNELEVFLLTEVYNEYSKLLKLINDHNTAKEYPFIMLGNYKSVNEETFLVFEKFIYGYKKGVELQSRIVNFDSDILTNTVNIDGFSVISIGHTHPNLSDDLIRETVAWNLEKDVKDYNKIRRPGLNLSVQDFIQYESLREQITNKKVLQTILMYNGELNIIDNVNGKYCKFSNITGLGLEDDFKIPVLEFDSSKIL